MVCAGSWEHGTTALSDKGIPATFLTMPSNLDLSSTVVDLGMEAPIDQVTQVRKRDSRHWTSPKMAADPLSSALTSPSSSSDDSKKSESMRLVSCWTTFRLVLGVVSFGIATMTSSSSPSALGSIPSNMNAMRGSTYFSSRVFMSPLCSSFSR